MRELAEVFQPFIGGGPGRFDPRFRAGTNTERVGKKHNDRLKQIDHSLTIADEEIFDVAEYWRMNPIEVGALSCRKFADLQERMFLQNERRAIINSTDTCSVTDTETPGEWKPYSGPKKKNVNG